MKYWILKSDPEDYSWDDMVRDGHTQWDGVRNYQARNNIRSMRPGDKAFFYHSMAGKEIVGIIRVVSKPYPDPTSDDDRWSVVDVEALTTLKQPVTLDKIKGEKNLSEIGLLRQSRLSVIPLTETEFKRILRLAHVSGEQRQTN